jgi:hypothetical protein
MVSIQFAMTRINGPTIYPPKNIYKPYKPCLNHNLYPSDSRSDSSRSTISTVSTVYSHSHSNVKRTLNSNECTAMDALVDLSNSSD